MSTGNAFPARNSVPDITHVVGVFTGGGAAANCSKASGDWIKGIESVAYNAATGKYLITFSEVGNQVVTDGCKVLRPTATAPLFACVIRGSLSQSAKTCQLEIRTESALTDLATTDKLLIDIGFSKSPPDA